MAAPFDDATTLLSNGAAAVRTYYRDSYDEMYTYFSKINKLFKPSKRRIDGNGIVVQVESMGLYGARTDTDVNADFPLARHPRPDSYTATFSETAASNDFRRMSLSLQVTWADLERVTTGRVAAVDWTANLIKKANRDIDSSLGLHRHIGTTAKLATINGTPAKNDKRFFADCAAIGTTGGTRFQIDAGSVSSIPAGLEIDVYNGATYKGSLFVTDYNPTDDSVGCFGLAGNARGGDPDSTVDVASIVADNYDLYVSTEYNKGLKTLQSWFEEPTASESFFARDRTEALYRWMIPHTSGPTSATQLLLSHFDDAAVQIAYINEDTDRPYIMLGTPKLVQRAKNVIGNDILYPYEPGKGSKLFAHYGFKGMMYHHESLGDVMFQSDSRAPVSEIKLLRVGDWEDCHLSKGTFSWLPGDGSSFWYRMQSSTPGNGRTTTFRMDGMMALCSICTFPKRQVRIRNVTS